MKPKTISRYMLLILLLAGLLLAGCRSREPEPTPTPEPTVAALEVAATLQPEAPVADDTPAAPTPDLPPVVLATSPERGQEQRLDVPIVVRFDRPMDPVSTAAAFAIQPEVPGQVIVEGQELVFTPAKPLARGAAYQVSIAESARSAGDKPLTAPLSLSVNTVGFLQVTSTQPADGNTEVAIDSPVTVIFNRPVVPLTGVDQMSDLPQPLSFDPPLAGQGEWLNTSIYTFRPDGPLPGATEFAVTVAAGLSDTTGGLLAEDHVFYFRTANPIVTSLAPGGNEVSPASPITVTFSQPMDQATTAAAFSLHNAQTDALIGGSFSWADGDRTLRFDPAQPLDFGVRYVAQVTTGARSGAGDGSLREPYVVSFQTAPRISISATQPGDGSQNVSPDENLRINFNGLVDTRSLGRKAFTIIPEPTGVFSYYSSYEDRWYINWPLAPRSDYTVTLSGDIADIFGNTLGQDRVIRFNTGDLRPFANLNVPGDVGTYNAYTNTLIAVSYRNVSRLDFRLSRVDAQQAESLLGGARWEMWDGFNPPESQIVRQWSVAVGSAPNSNALDKIPLSDDGGPLAPGAYWLELRAPEISYSTNGRNGQRAPHHLLIVSPLNMIVKKAPGEILVWATDLQSGQPVAELPMRVAGKAGKSGQTDGDGVFRAAIPLDNAWEPVTIFAGQTESGPYGIASSDWQTGLSPWEFDLPADFMPRQWQATIYSDRPIYRPGQTIFWKGVLRADSDGLYSLPEPGTQLLVTIRDGQGEEVYKATHETNSFGTFYGELPLDAEAGLGYYYLEALMQLDPSQDSPGFGYSFQVAEYRKPEFEISLTTDEDEYLQGDTINASLAANFFFGGPVANAQVEWTVFSNDAYFNYNGDGWYSFNDYSGWDSRPSDQYGGLLTSGSGVTDSQGRFTFQIPADISDKLQSQNFNIDVRLVDLNNQEVSASHSVVVHKGLVYPGISPRSYVGEVGEANLVDLLTVDWASQPVANQELTVVVNRAKWNVVRELGDDGNYYWMSHIDETPVLTETLTTDGQGQAVLTWTPDAGGQYKINAAVVDRQGNQVQSSAFTWISDSRGDYVSWRVDNNDRIELIADKSLYGVGDTARILIPHPYQGAVEALVTVERGGFIDVQRITLAGNSETLELPIEAAFVPNVYVSVAIVKGQDAGNNDLGSFKLGYVELPVSAASKELQVRLTPSQEQLRPGETVTFTVQVNDRAGRPVQGEFSLSLVDKALLSLSSGEPVSLLDAFYSQRGLGVQTASSLVLNLDRLNQQLREGAKGGGGGGPAADMAVMFDVRSDFQDMALWEPALVTDENGQGVISVALPDNLTTWRLDARGLTKDTEVGQATVDIVTTLPLLVRPVLPRFFVTGDQAEIGAIINNNTDADRDLLVELAGSGWELTGGEVERTVNVPAGGQIKLTWPVQILSPAAGVDVGEAGVLIMVSELTPLSADEPLADAVEMTLPVYRYTSPETVGTAGTVALNENRLESIVLPPAVDPTQGDLKVRLEPSLAAGMIEGLNWLEHFPYECNEQVVSKFLPNVVSYEALARLDVVDPDLQANLQEQIATALQKLIQRQNADGGWGWWPGDASQPFISSYVVFGLVEAQKAGFITNDEVIARGADYLTRQLKALDGLQSYQLNQQAFLLYVLAGAGDGDIGRTVALYDVRERLSEYGVATLALTLGELADQGEGSAAARIPALIDDLNSTAILSATGAHWEEGEHDWWNMGSNTRSTSLALAALARLAPDNPLAPNVVRWLMVARTAGRWQTTQENAWAIIALTDWMDATGELKADYSYSVTLNEAELGSGSVNRDNVDQPVDLRVEVGNLLLDTANALRLTRTTANGQTGGGQLYYTAHLTTYLPVSALEARDRGVVVAREYSIIDPQTGKVVDAAPGSAAQVGDTVQVKLTIIAPHDLHYLVLESPLPAGAEAIDPSLATTSQVYEGPQLNGDDDRPWWFWTWTPTYSELRDEKVVLFATRLAAGSYEYTYQMRASLPGQFQTLPVTAYEMYFPEVWGRSAGELFEIGE